MNALPLLTGPLAQAIGWALLHLLWQAVIVAGILAAVLALIPRRNANARYGAACAALAIVFVMFVTTTVRSYDPFVAPVAAAAAAENEAQLTRLTIKQVPIVLASLAAESSRDGLIELVARARRTLPSIVALWLAGVVFLSTRLMISWMRARRLAHRGAQEAGIEWQRVAARLSDALGLRRAVKLLESAAVEVPSVIGSLRPVILLPASTLTGLTPQQIEMVLAHELAHIRRHDFLVNLLQAVVETLMFYHPAVWWISRRVRAERENCCDDMAVAVCGNPIQYARALTRLEELRSAPSLIVAANGGSLLDRIRRIAGGRAESTAVSARWVAAMITLVVLAIGVSVPSLPAFADREDKAAQGATTAVEVTAPVATTVVAEPGEPVEHDLETDDIETEGEAAAEAAVDYDYDYDDDTPTAVIAPEARPALTPRPARAIAPRAMAVLPTPRPGRAAPVAAIAAAGFDFADEDEEETPRARTRANEESDKKIGSGKLTVDELIGLKAVGVTAEYIDAMRSIFGELTVGQVRSLRAVGVTPEFVREIREAGLEVAAPSTATNLRALGVTAEFIRALRAAGVSIKTAREASSLKATGVTVEFVRKLAAAGYTNLSVSELSRMAAVGIDEEFIREMEKYRQKK